MSGWSTFFFVLSIIQIILSIFAFVFLNLVGFIGVVVSALFCLAVSKLFGALDEILKNQKKIIIMLDNLSE